MSFVRGSASAVFDLMTKLIRESEAVSVPIVPHGILTLSPPSPMVTIRGVFQDICTPSSYRGCHTMPAVEGKAQRINPDFEAARDGLQKGKQGKLLPCMIPFGTLAARCGILACSCASLRCPKDKVLDGRYGVRYLGDLIIFTVLTHQYDLIPRPSKTNTSTPPR